MALRAFASSTMGLLSNQTGAGRLGGNVQNYHPDRLVCRGVRTDLAPFAFGAIREFLRGTNVLRTGATRPAKRSREGYRVERRMVESQLT
jgi:hypothetical protein